MVQDSKIFIIFLILFGSAICSNNEDKYFFQIYPSVDTNNPHYLYVLTNEKFLTINATEGENCKIISSTSIDESTYKNISSSIIINDTYLVKTCFMNNKLIEIVHNKNTFSYKKNLDNIKYCYSSQILNPFISSDHPDKYVIITYYTQVQTGGKYSHNAILFYPLANTFSEDYTLKADTSLIINDYYPENCVTLRYEDIYCSIHFTGHSLIDVNPIGNNYVIETNKLFLSDENIFLVVSNSIISTSNYYKRFIPLNRQESTYVVTKLKYGIKDIYLTEYHDQEGAIKTWLKFSYYISDSHLSYIKSDKDYGLKISDKSINPKLINYIAPNQDELLIIYLNKDTKTNLLISRIYTKNIDSNFNGYAINNYYRQDICSNPMFMQSTYMKSFINYEKKDKEYMKNNPHKSYYIYEKDIGIVISCSTGYNVDYQTIKVEVPQCLNVLDEINGNSLHKLEFNDNNKEIIFDIYNDPNMISFRNVSIYFNSSELFSVLITMKIKESGKSDYTSIQYDKEYKDISHIKFIKNNFLPVKSTFKLPYFLQFKGKNLDNIVNAMQSDLCYLEFSVDYGTNQPKCLVDYCSVCETEDFCKVCNPDIPGLILDTDIKSVTFGKCICDENRGFLKSPELYQMCICKEGYSFYKGKQLCNITETLNNGTFYEVEIDEKSNITVYDDCPAHCQQCEKNERGDLVCLECFEGFFLRDDGCVEGEFESGEWFKLDKYVFKYVKMDQCILIFERGDLFLISDKDKCDPYMSASNYKYISEFLQYDINETIFMNLENVFIYNSSSEGIIAEKYSEDNKIHFHLVKYKANNSGDVSDISITKNGENITDDILIFKADIKRDDTISTQVEYQLFDPNSGKINEKLNLIEENGNLEVLVSVPVTLSEEQRARIKELNSQGIDIFDSSSSFYLDVCFKFTTPDNEDMFLEERKKEYFINEPFCESDCSFKEYDYDTQRALCLCKFKENTDNYDKVTFVYNPVDEKFKKRFTSPNLKAMKCSSVVSKNIMTNFGFIFTLLFLLIFTAFFVYAMVKEHNKLRDELEEKKKSILDEKDDINSNKDNVSQNSGKDNPKPESENKPVQIFPYQNGENDNNSKIISVKNKNKRSIHNNNDNNNKNVLITNSEKDDIRSESTNNNNNENNINSGKVANSLIDTNNPNSNIIDGSENKENGLNDNKDDDNNKTNDDGNETNKKGNNSNKDTLNNNNSGENNQNDRKEVNSEKISIKPKNDGNIDLKSQKSDDDNNKTNNDGNEANKKGNNGNEDTLNNNNRGENNQNDRNEVNSEKISIIPKDDENIDLKSQKSEIDDKFKKIRESITNSEINPEPSAFFLRKSYSRDSKRERNEEEGEEEGEIVGKEEQVNITQIYMNVKQIKKKKVIRENSFIGNNMLIFDEEARKEIESSFIQKEVKVNSMLTKGDKKNNLQKKDNKANPPGKKKLSPEVADSQQRLNEKNSGKEKEVLNNDYILDKTEFKELGGKERKDKRNILYLLWSVIKNNSTIILVFSCIYYEYLFVRVSLIILFISFYLCLNTFLLYEMPMVQLFTGGCTFGNLILNIFITSLVVNILMIIIKKYMSTKEMFFNELNIKIEKNISIQENIQEKPNNEFQNESINNEIPHQLSDKINRFVRTMKKRIRIYGVIGVLFLIFNCILVTSFCGVYSNSVGELFLNTFVSMILSSIIIRILFFLIGVILRYYSFKRNSELMYNISRLFNPLNLSWEEFEAMDFSGICKICEKKPKMEEGNLKDRAPGS